MRLLLSKLLRRAPPSPPPRLLYFSTHHASSSSSSSPRFLFTSSVHYHHHNHLWQHENNPQSSSLFFLSPNNCFCFSRQYSSQPDIPDLGEPFLPVRVLISVLDSYHDFTGFPWWIIISSSALAMRLTLFPLVVLQQKKLKRIGELLPKLPPAFPPPMSGKSFRDQISLFWKEKKAAGCPSLVWFFASFAVQVPCFFLWIMSIRRMSLGHHPGFDCGGTLWFQNLTELPNGMWGPIFPLFIAGLHFANVQISFKSSLQQLPGSIGLLAKWYKIYLQLLTLPIVFAAFNIPQGSSVYWLMNSSLTLIQHICLSHPGVIEYLGLGKTNQSAVPPANKGGNSGVRDIFVLTKRGKVSAESLSPRELASFSVKVLTDGHVDTALKLLRLALEKDPEYARALFVMGQTLLLKKKQFAEATECLEGAASKLTAAGHPTEVEQVDLLILSSLWAGIANVKQGKMEEGVVHLERIAQLEEPGDPKSKAHYYDLLLVLSSVLLNLNRKAEAGEYLNKAAAYDPAYTVYLKDLENDVDNISSDLEKKIFELDQ